MTLTSEEIYNAFYADYIEKKTFYHGHTYTGNPISCSAALASLEIFEEEDVLTKEKLLMPTFHSQLERFHDLDIVGDVRYIGMLGALELVRDKKTKEPFGFGDRIGVKIYKRGLNEGLILRPLGSVIYFCLPLCIKETEIVTVLEKTYKILEEERPLLHSIPT